MSSREWRTTGFCRRAGFKPAVSRYRGTRSLQGGGRFAAGRRSYHSGIPALKSPPLGSRISNLDSQFPQPRIINACAITLIPLMRRFFKATPPKLFASGFRLQASGFKLQAFSR